MNQTSTTPAIPAALASLLVPHVSIQGNCLTEMLKVVYLLQAVA